jgi:2-phospho-L-lactate guanylyltransferase
MNARRDVYAVVPIKETEDAKRRLAGVLDAPRRRELALASRTCWRPFPRSRLAGIIIVTMIRRRPRPRGIRRACLRKARTCRGAVAAAAHRRASKGRVTVPGEIPLVEADDIRKLIEAHRGYRGVRAFIIVPARDERGSNAVLCSPATAVPLRFGTDSFLPHLAASKRQGI